MWNSKYNFKTLVGYTILILHNSKLHILPQGKRSKWSNTLYNLQRQKTKVSIQWYILDLLYNSFCKIITVYLYRLASMGGIIKFPNAIILIKTHGESQFVEVSAHHLVFVIYVRLVTLYNFWKRPADIFITFISVNAFAIYKA